MEVESRLRGVATKALVDGRGFHGVDVGLNLGNAAPREDVDISAEVQRLAAIKEAAAAKAPAAAKLAGAQGARAAPGGQVPQALKGH